MIPLLFLSTWIIGWQDVRNDYPPPGDYPHNFEISEVYDKFKDITTLKLKLGVVCAITATNWK